MPLQFGNEWTDEHGRVYRELTDPNDGKYLYRKDKKMWTTRGLAPGREYPEDFKQRVIQSQLPDYSKPGFTTVMPLLDRVVAEKRQSGECEVAIVEIGAADGPTVRHFKKYYPEMTLRFFGVEALGFLAEEGARKHPGQHFQPGTAEDFLEIEFEALGHGRFDLFLASGTLCMLLPDLARAVLVKAHQIAADILCRDYLANTKGEISSDHPVMFELMPGHEHILFANPYELILRDMGFSDIDYVFEDLDETAVRGTGSFLGRRS